jgi:tRNA nucleotidyltransferase (CCA-adding enzyme)
MKITSDILPPSLAPVLLETPEMERAYLVGGCVRDWILGVPNKDCDVEVFGVDYERLVQALRRWGRIDVVGRSFGVVKLTVPDGETFDFSIPRRDSKTAPGHKGILAAFDPSISPKEAASRRDYTINALMYNPRTGAVDDFFGGLGDIRDRMLRHISDAFTEDPLRVLRGMQFAARFGLAAAPETIELCRGIKHTHGELAGDRIREEWYKWASKSKSPSAGLRFLRDTEWIVHYPEINALIGTPQDPDWHPEGDVFTHTCHCCDALVELPQWQAANEESKIVYMFAVLAHDFAKPATTTRAVKDGRERIVSPGHEELGGPLAEAFLHRIHAARGVVERVFPLVANHLAHLQTVTDRSVRRLARRILPETIAGLSLVITADAFGRPPKPKIPPASLAVLMAKADELELQASAPKPILLGRHLLEQGMQPGREIGRFTSLAYEAQLDGQFFTREEALRWVQALGEAKERNCSSGDGAGGGACPLPGVDSH